MKKTFELTHPKLKRARLVDAIKYEVKKYIKRERNKQLPIDADFWDFDCKYGKSEMVADVIHISEINKKIDEADQSEAKSFYLEIMAKTGIRQKKPIENIYDENATEEDS